MRRLLIALVLALGARADLVRAQAVDIQHYQPATNLEGLATVKGAGVEKPFTSTLDLTTVYLHEPLALVDEQGATVDLLVKSRVDVFLSYAMALHERVALAAVVPFVPFQVEPVRLEAGQLLEESQTTVALADPRVEVRITLLTEAGQGIDVAVIPGVSFATGGGAGYVSSDTTLITGELAVGRRLGPILLAANLGYRYRGGGADTLERFDMELSDQVLWRAGVGLDLGRVGLPRDSQLAVEGFGLAQAQEPLAASRQSPMEALASLRVRVLEDFVVSAGGGTGIGDGYGAPRAIAMLGMGWAPRPEPEPLPTPIAIPPEPAPAVVTPADSDGDGLTDDVDKCPQDFGPADNQGCPWPDQDGDGVADKDDRCVKVGGQPPHGCPDTDGDGLADHVDGCPHIPGPEPTGCPTSDRDGDGVLDDVDLCPDVPGDPPKGCPKQVLVVKHEDRIEIKQQINFETNRATIIGRTSFEILDQVAAVLRSNPMIHVVIEGHTDDRGPDAYNLELSQSRASAVREALLERGIDAARLEAVGYGESKPVASNRSAKGRATNRRSEFKIVQAGEAAPAGPTAPKAEPSLKSQAPDPHFFHLRLKKAQTLREIAKALWGSDTHAALLAEHNPGAGGPEGRIAAGGEVKLPRTISYIVQKGDTLGGIAKGQLGNAKHYKLIAEASRAVMPDPNQMDVGMTLTIPLVLPAMEKLQKK